MGNDLQNWHSPQGNKGTWRLEDEWTGRIGRLVSTPSFIDYSKRIKFLCLRRFDEADHFLSSWSRCHDSSCREQVIFLLHATLLHNLFFSSPPPPPAQWCNPMLFHVRWICVTICFAQITLTIMSRLLHLFFLCVNWIPRSRSRFLHQVFFDIDPEMIVTFILFVHSVRA